MKPKSFSFNKIYLIESINTKIQGQEGLAFGSTLSEILTKELETLKANDPKHKNLSCELIKIDGLEDWQATMDRIADDCNKGIRPIMHFICHGVYDEKKNITCMLLADSKNAFSGYTSISWEKVARSLEKINVACHNNLMVTLATCYGSLLYSVLLQNDLRIPFYCLLSKPSTVSKNESIGMLCFYVSLLNNHKLDSAKNDLYQYVYNGEVPEGNNKLDITYADEIFKNLVKLRCKNEKTGECKAFWKQNYESVVAYKFMYDLYPEEKYRIDLPSTFEELMQ